MGEALVAEWLQALTSNYQNLTPPTSSSHPNPYLKYYGFQTLTDGQGFHQEVPYYKMI
jgi:hypothetical protein